MARAFTLTADGGSRGNPGPAGYGAVVSEDGKIVAELYDYIGVATNNVAEYQGLIAGLIHIHSLDPEATVEVQMDSKLVVEQMSGRWQIKHSNMRELAAQARAAHTPSLGQMLKEVTEVGVTSIWNTASIGAPIVMRTA